ncbi:MAG: ABC transporter permease [Bacillus sp. (in: firmicutes)]
MNSNQLWRERFTVFVGELQKYVRYILNGHLVFVMIIGLGGLAYYYSEWVKTLGPSFPAAELLALIIALPLTNSPVYSLLKEPDMFFLLPVERRMDGYFRKAIRLSLVFQSYILLLFLAAAMPLFAAVEGGTFRDFVLILILTLVAKYLNLLSKWSVLKFQEQSTIWLDNVIRFCLNAGLLYVAFSRSALFTAIVFILLAGLAFYYYKATEAQPLRWERLIALESRRMQMFYRFANMFTDVPKLKERIARRKWLDPLLSVIGYRQANTYSYLYLRTFIRSGDFFGLYIRLTVIGLFVLLSLTSLIPQMIGAGLFIYMTGFQLIMIRKQHDSLIWHDLYPVSKEVKDKSIHSLLLTVLGAQAGIFALTALFTGGLVSAALVLVTGFFILLLLRTYYQKMIRLDEDKWE